MAKIRVLTHVVQHNYKGKPIGKVHAYLGATVPEAAKVMCGFENGERTSFKATRAYISCKKCEAAMQSEFTARPMTRPEMDAHEKRLLVAPWPMIGNTKVTTCGYEEEALGLTDFIAGWGPRGYYVRNDKTLEETQAFIDSIDWERVVRVKSDFDMRMSGGVMLFTDVPVYFVTVARYQRLMRHCLRSVPLAKFEREMQIAIKQCHDNGQKRTTVSGSLEVSH